MASAALPDDWPVICVAYLLQSEEQPSFTSQAAHLLFPKSIYFDQLQAVRMCTNVAALNFVRSVPVMVVALGLGKFVSVARIDGGYKNSTKGPKTKV
jgi:hypothetical protein